MPETEQQLRRNCYENKQLKKHDMKINTAYFFYEVLRNVAEETEISNLML